MNIGRQCYPVAIFYWKYILPEMNYIHPLLHETVIALCEFIIYLLHSSVNHKKQLVESKFMLPFMLQLMGQKYPHPMRKMDNKYHKQSMKI